VRNPEDGGDVFSETSVLSTAAWYKVPEDLSSVGNGVCTRFVQKETYVARHNVGEHVPAATDTHTTMDELLETTF
jgi:hypothetical protein